MASTDTSNQTSMTSPPDNLSYSQMRTFKECRYKWHKHYVEGLRFRGREMPRLLIGSLIHKGLEAAFLLHAKVEPADPGAVERAIFAYHDEYIEKHAPLAQDYIDELEELAEKAVRITIRALDWLDLSLWEVVILEDGTPLVEKLLEMPQNYWAHFIGYLDVVLREKSTGNVYLIDVKCRDKFQTFENEETNEQFPIYQKLLQRLGVVLSGVMTWQIKTREPLMPELTKKGTLSRKKMTTDWPTYLQAIEACGFDPADYDGVREWAEKVQFQGFSRNYRSEVEVENIWMGIYAVAKEMKRVDLPIYRNLRPGFAGCHDCSMREICLTELRGGDVDWIKKTRYRHRSEPNTPLPLTAEVTLHE